MTAFPEDIMPDAKRRRFRLPGWPVMVIGVCLLLLIGAPMFAWGQAYDNPVVKIPLPAMPSPNAYDYYLRAANLLPPVLVDPAQLSTLTPAQRATMLALRAQVLALYTQGTQFPCLSPPIRSYDTRMPYLLKYRRLAWYFADLAIMAGEQRKWAEAMEDSLILLRFSADSIHGSNLIGALVGYPCAGIGRQQAWNALDHLSPTEARTALETMEEINAREVPFSQIMLEEKWFDEASLLEIFHAPHWQEVYVREHDVGNTDSIARSSLATVNKRVSFTRLQAYFDTCIAMTKGPFSRRTPDAQLVPDDIICRMSVPVCEKGWVKSLQTITGNRLLTMQLALRAYHGEHGVYPARLAPLVTGGYLHKLPDDPFALSGSFHYRRKEGDDLLYSVGPDGIDDGGKPIMNKDHPIQVESKGDIVAGVNRL